jgi:hypothetical protein
MFHWSDWLRASFSWPNDKFASFVDVTDCDQDCCSYRLPLGKPFNFFMKDLAIVEPNDKDATMICL